MKFVIGVQSSRYHVFLVVVLMLLISAFSIHHQNVNIVVLVTALTTTSSTSTSTTATPSSIIPEDHKLFETYNKFQSWKNSNKNSNILQEFQVQEKHLVTSTTTSNDNDNDDDNQNNQRSQSRNLRISHFASSNVCFGISDSLQTPNAANLACRAERLKINNDVVTGARRIKVGDVITYMNDKSDRRTNVPSDNSERAKRFCASRLRVVKTLSDTGASHTPLRVLYEDNCMAIVCKPAGIHSMSYSGTFGKSLCLDEILPLLLQPPTEDNFDNDNDDENGDEPLPAPLPCHRLDRRVAGPVVVAKTRRALVALTRCFEEKTVTKEYRALVSGEIDTNNTNTIANTKTNTKTNTNNVTTGQGNNSTTLSSSSTTFTITSDIDGRESETEVVVLDKTPCNMNGILTDLQLFPKTGRTHQLRIHCANVLQTPIIGDDLYWNYEVNEVGNDSIPNPVPIRKRHGLYLYCRKVFIPHPLHVGKIVSAEIPEPFRITRTREKSLKGYEWSKAAAASTAAAAAAEKTSTKQNESESAQEYFRRVMYAR
ncbi:pseudouridine synthase [Fragilariopsis cylindrus CCMP1102]|uniref:Pseudouridine synthase n=1 Tax=Fragilariopsis cylindrus CCMP1102 TaxID=635003 RepID=A0A1E7FTC6_9STRA|nr:pseudouridine synthase [Fragilariopsis cylindrus CCMP1102]|eukprot:OEU21408.1 pseudouridine synthase [Fragilariopsis cylindrus CCMP1102]